MAPLVAGDPLEGGRPARIAVDRREGVVEDDRVALELEVVETLGGVDRGHLLGDGSDDPALGADSRLAG